MKTKTLEWSMNHNAFRHISGNRPVKEPVVLQLVESFKRNYVPFTLKVNGKEQIIDGQHRLEAAKRLGLGFWLERMNGAGINEVQVLNSVNNAWNKRAFLKSYCEQGVSDYIRFQEFMDNNPDFGIAIAEILLTNGTENRQVSQVGGIRVTKSRIFEDGQFKIADLSLAYENAGKIREYKQFYNGYNRRSFVRVMIQLFKNKKFDNERMLHKLSMNPTALVDCSTAEQYRLLIEGIYNFKSSEKINLRY